MEWERLELTCPDTTREGDDETQPQQDTHADAMLQRHLQSHDQRNGEDRREEIRDTIEDSNDERGRPFIQTMAPLDGRKYPVRSDRSAHRSVYSNGFLPRGVEEQSIRAEPDADRSEADAQTHNKEHATVQDPDEPRDSTVPHETIVEQDERNAGECRCLDKEELCAVGDDPGIFVPVAEEDSCQQLHVCSWMRPGLTTTLTCRVPRPTNACSSHRSCWRG